MKLSKQLGVLGVVALMLACSPSPDKSTRDKIAVGVLEAYGGAGTCIRETIGAVTLDDGMTVTKLSPSDIASGLHSFDVLIIPGGSGSRQHLDLGASNRQKVSQWVESGGIVIGICAGAYLLSDTPEYACMNLSGAQAIDIEHDHRGHGIAKVTLEDAGRRVFPRLADQDTLYLMYYEGPVLIPAFEDKSPKYTSLATMQSDVHLVAGTPSGMTNDKPFLIETKVGNGLVYSIVGHPEATPGMQWMVPDLVRYALGIERVDYGEAIDFGLFGKEILATEDILLREEHILKELMLGTIEQKISAIEYLSTICSWEGKSWVRGLLYDKSPDVRLAAARYMTSGRYVAYIDDMRRLAELENAPLEDEIKEEIQKMESYLSSKKTYTSRD